MPPTLQEVSELAGTLDDSDKSRLVNVLLTQLHQVDPSIEQIWADEVVRRVQADEEGRLETYSYEEVMARFKKP